MSVWFTILTVLFICTAVAAVLIILVQRPQGGGLAGAFGGTGGGTDTVFGGRVGDALTWATVIAFSAYLVLAVLLTRVPITGTVTAATPADGVSAPIDGTAPEAPGMPAPGTPAPGTAAPGAATPGTTGGAAAPPGGAPIAPIRINPPPSAPASGSSGGGAPPPSGGGQ